MLIWPEWHFHLSTAKVRTYVGMLCSSNVCVCEFVHACMCAYVCACMCACICVCMHTCVHMCVHAYMRACVCWENWHAVMHHSSHPFCKVRCCGILFMHSLSRTSALTQTVMEAGVSYFCCSLAWLQICTTCSRLLQGLFKKCWTWCSRRG